MTSNKVIACFLAAAGMGGLYAHIEYSGWVLATGLFILIVS